MNESKKRVIVGLSGGVDSSVAALLLLEQGYQVEALFMKNWEEEDDDKHCTSAEDLVSAQKVCEKLNIKLHTINFSKEYWDTVFENFLVEHRLGRTPNPDVLCNREIKFKTFLNYALELGADCIATGHYVQNAYHINHHQLHKGQDPNKDQSYFLYTLTQNALSKSLFPIGHLDKPTVRKIAKNAGLPTYLKKESMGICFIGKRNFKQFLNRFMPTEPGKMETPEGKIIGQHDGLMFYTIGQRQGLGIGGQSNTDNAAWYVVKKDLERNVLMVAQGKDHPLLYKTSLEATALHWIAEIPPQFPLTCSAKIRYRQEDVPCTLERIDAATYKVIFKMPQWAVTPGQSVVFYQHNTCLGGGIIH